MLYKDYIRKIGGLFHKCLVAEQGPGSAEMPFKYSSEFIEIETFMKLETI